MYAGDELYDDNMTSGVPVEGPVPTTIQNRWNDAHDDDYDDYDDEDDDCTWCGGEGYSSCDDPLGCPGPHIGGSAMAGGECPCRPCGGSGLRSKQTVF